MKISTQQPQENGVLIELVSAACFQSGRAAPRALFLCINQSIDSSRCVTSVHPAPAAHHSRWFSLTIYRSIIEKIRRTS